MKKKENRNTIKTKIQKVITRLLTVSLLIVGAFSCVLCSVVTISTLQTSMSTLASEVSQYVVAQMDASLNQVEMIGANQTVANFYLSKEDKKAAIESYVDAYGWEFATVLNSIGEDTIYDTGNYASKDYFKTAYGGTTTMSEPVLDSATGKLTITYAAPLWEDGLIGTQIIGVAMIE